MDYEYVEAYIPWLESNGPEKVRLAGVYRRWLEYLDLKRDRQKVYSVFFRKAWDEGFAKRIPVEILYKMAELAGRKAQLEFVYPDEPKIGVDPALDSLRARYDYRSYTRVEVRAAVEKELKQIRDTLNGLRSIGGEKFNRDTLPYITKAIDNFLEAQPDLEVYPVAEKGKLGKGVKETTRLLSLIKFADLLNPIFDSLSNLQKTMEIKSEYLDELAWRLNGLVTKSGVAVPQKSEEETSLEKWQRDKDIFENSKTQSFDLVRLAWDRLTEFAGIELAFNPKYTDRESFLSITHFQEKTPDNRKMVAFCRAWLTYLKTADLEAARHTFWGSGLLDVLQGKDGS